MLEQLVVSVTVVLLFVSFSPMQQCLSLCSVLGPAFTLLPKGYVAPSHWFPIKHAEYSNSSHAARVVLGQHPQRLELLLIPINAVQGSLPENIG